MRSIAIDLAIGVIIFLAVCALRLFAAHKLEPRDQLHTARARCRTQRPNQHHHGHKNRAQKSL